MWGTRVRNHNDKRKPEKADFGAWPFESPRFDLSLADSQTRWSFRQELPCVTSSLFAVEKSYSLSVLL